jgi:hypothetical protein
MKNLNLSDGEMNYILNEKKSGVFYATGTEKSLKTVIEDFRISIDSMSQLETIITSDYPGVKIEISTNFYDMPKKLKKLISFLDNYSQ